MQPLRIAIAAESTGLPLRTAVAEAAKFAADGIEADATGDLAPESLTATGRREFRNLMRSYRQDLAALAAPLRRGLDVAEDQEPRLDYLRKAMQLAFDLDARRVVVPLPALPADETSPRAHTLRESVTALGVFGDRVGTTVAFEIGFDPAEKVRDYLSGFDSGSLKVTFDPANLLVHGFDPVASLAPLKGLLAHAHARDVRAASVSAGLQEVPLGSGNIDWMALIATLHVLDFDGFLTVKRQPGGRRLAELAAGVKFLRRFAAG